jgi:hypothetical protein
VARNVSAVKELGGASDRSLKHFVDAVSYLAETEVWIAIAFHNGFLRREERTRPLVTCSEIGKGLQRAMNLPD